MISPFPSGNSGGDSALSGGEPAREPHQLPAGAGDAPHPAAFSCLCLSPPGPSYGLPLEKVMKPLLM